MARGNAAYVEVSTLEAAESGLDEDVGEYTEKDDFNEWRKMCLSDSEQAAETLTSYAQIHVDVIAARDLAPMDYGVSVIGLKSSSDPYVEIHLNDIKLPELRTDIIKRNLNPTWKEKVVKIDLTLPHSILHFLVWDKDRVQNDDLIGFIEVPLSDLRVDEPVEGWFNLRKPAELHGKAPARIEKHKADCTNKLDGGADNAEDDKAEDGDVEAPPMMLALKMTKTIQSPDHDDEVYAFALDRPVFKDWPDEDGRVIDHGEDLGARHFQPQEFSDDLHDVHVNLVHGIIMPFILGLQYIVCWRERKITAPLFVWGLFLCLYPTYLRPSIAAWLGLLLLLVRNKQRRRRMCCQACQAPLSDEGLRLVAATRSVDVLSDWLLRVIEAMNGELTLHEKSPTMLREFAAFSYTDSGQPVCESYADLKEELRRANENADTRWAEFSPKSLEPGTLVYLLLPRDVPHPGNWNEKFARLMNVNDEVRCTVRDYVPGHEKNHGIGGSYEVRVPKVAQKDDRDVGGVQRHELVVRRNLMWLEGKAVRHLIPENLENTFKWIQLIVDGMEENVRSVQAFLNGIVCWESRYTLIIVLSLFAFAIGRSFCYYTHKRSVIDLEVLVQWILAIFNVAAVSIGFLAFHPRGQQWRKQRFAAQELDAARKEGLQTWSFYSEKTRIRDSLKSPR